MPNKNLEHLLLRFFRNELDEKEKESLVHWLNQQTDDKQLADLIEHSWNDFQPAEHLTDDQARQMLEGIMREANLKETKNSGILRFALWKWAAVAASVILLISIGGYYFTNKNHELPDDSITRAAASEDVKFPDANRATITLANGQTIYLDSASDGSLMTHGSVQLIKLADGKIGYMSTSAPNDHSEYALVYNTLRNPRGSRVINMQLSDGSRVWLNAGSSLTYPVIFSGRQRKVTIDGEGYFEIEPDQSKPFYVTKGNVEVKVLGTHFNVDAYGDDQEIKVTLLEGRVRVAQSDTKNKEVFLKPGEQARVASEDNEAGTITITSANTDQVMAWKNGKFIFQDEEIKSVMRKLERWYDVSVTYQADVSHERFVGVISRNVNLKRMLSMLEKAGDVRFTIVGNTVIVK